VGDGEGSRGRQGVDRPPASAHLGRLCGEHSGAHSRERGLPRTGFTRGSAHDLWGGNPCVPDRAAVAHCSDLGLPETIPLIKWASL